MLPQILIAASAATWLFAGALHLHATFFGPDLRPHDPKLEVSTKEDSTYYLLLVSALALLLYGIGAALTVTDRFSRPLPKERDS
jgi:hypothetical protein